MTMLRSMSGSALQTLSAPTRPGGEARRIAPLVLRAPALLALVFALLVAAVPAGAAEGGRTVGSGSRGDERPTVSREGTRRLVGRPAFSPQGFDSIVVFATNSVEIKRGATMSGDVVVNDAAPGATLIPGFELELARDAVIDGNVRADSVHLNRNSTVTGDVTSNGLTDKGASIGGTVSSPLALPVFPELPTFEEAFQTGQPGPDVHVAAGTTLNLPPGPYGHLTIANTGVLVLRGGYDFLSVSDGSGGGQCPFPCRSIHLDGEVTVRVEGRVNLGKDSFVGPLDPITGAPAACPIDPAGGGTGNVFYVGGTNADPSNPNSLPAAFSVGQSSCLGLNVYAPNGTIQVDKNSSATGAFLARDVRFDGHGTLASAFVNQPPIADPQSVQTGGQSSITITLTGSDPEGGSLGFSIVTQPTEGTLTNLTPIVPAPINTVDRDGNPIVLQPPTTSATVVYTPTDPNADAEDSFVFAVTDPPGASGVATVTINPFDGTTPDGPVEDIVALDRTVEVVGGSTQVVDLQADAPDGTVLVFTVLTLPAGTLTDSGGNPIESPGYVLPDAQVVYTAPSSGPDGFDFEVSDAAAVLTADVGTVTFVIDEQAELAEDLSVETEENTPVNITLGANPGGTSGSSSSTVRIFGEVTTPNSAEVGGNVADADSNGEGDNVNALPGATPGLVSAGVDLSGGPGSNGVARIQIEWDIASLHGTVGDPLFIDSARVILHTLKGTVDSLDTEFYAGAAEQDGLLTNSDFEAPVIGSIFGSTMPVPPDPTGTEGTFTFNVTGELNFALCGFAISTCDPPADFFSVQGRVIGEQDLVGGGSQRGLQVRSTATSNPLAKRPILEVETSSTILTWRIESLPTNGILRFNGQPVSVGDRFFTAPTVQYVPNLGFSATDGFTYSVKQGLVLDFALVNILVLDDGCAEDGRDPGCSPGG